MIVIKPLRNNLGDPMCGSNLRASPMAALILRPSGSRLGRKFG